MFSLDNTCPQCGRIGFEGLRLAKQQRKEVTVTAFCRLCLFQSPPIQLCPRVSQAVLSSAVLDGPDAPFELFGSILNCASLIPTTGPLAENVNGKLRSLFNYEDDGDTISHTRLDDTVFAKLIWFGGMYGLRFITLGQLRDLLERSVGSPGKGTHVSGEGL